MKSLGTILGFAARDLEDVVRLLSSEPEGLLRDLPLTPPLAGALTRECWLLEFVAELIREVLHRGPTSSLREAAAAAYKETLAPRHPFPIRMCVQAALLLLPSRASFLLQLAGGEEARLPGLPAELEKFVRDVATVRVVLEEKLAQ